MAKKANSNQNSKLYPYQIKSQLHEQYAINNNANLGSIISFIAVR